MYWKVRRYDHPTSCVLLQPVASCSSLPASGVKKPPLAGVTTVYLGL